MQKLLLIEAWALLNNLRKAILAARQNALGEKIIRVYSGHDITLEPLMLMLELKHPIPPHYASRMVFEVCCNRRSKKDLIFYVAAL